jgi:alpha-1,3-rhamnosyltransferase
MDSQDQPFISIIVITYNSAAFVLETLESIKNQSYSNIELIISDDNSSDHTIALCETWLFNNKERFFKTSIITVDVNTGIPANCNRGIKASSGSWIKIIAGDDSMYSEYIQQCITYIHKNKGLNINFLWTNIRRYRNSFKEENALPYENLTDFKINSDSITAKEQFEILLRFNPILAISFIFNREALYEASLFNEKYTLFEDWPMWLNLTYKGYKIHYLDIIGVKYRQHTQSIQLKKTKKNQLINDFNLQKSRLILNEYVRFYPFFERMHVIYLNSINLLFDKLRINKNHFLYWLTFKLLTYFPRKVLNTIRIKYR